MNEDRRPTWYLKQNNNNNNKMEKRRNACTVDQKRERKNKSISLLDFFSFRKNERTRGMNEQMERVWYCTVFIPK